MKSFKVGDRVKVKTEGVSGIIVKLGGPGGNSYQVKFDEPRIIFGYLYDLYWYDADGLVGECTS